MRSTGRTAPVVRRARRLFLRTHRARASNGLMNERTLVRGRSLAYERIRAPQTDKLARVVQPAAAADNKAAGSRAAADKADKAGAEPARQVFKLERRNNAGPRRRPARSCGRIVQPADHTAGRMRNDVSQTLCRAASAAPRRLCGPAAALSRRYRPAGARRTSNAARRPREVKIKRDRQSAAELTTSRRRPTGSAVFVA